MPYPSSIPNAACTQDPMLTAFSTSKPESHARGKARLWTIVSTGRLRGAGCGHRRCCGEVLREDKARSHGTWRGTLEQIISCPPRVTTHALGCQIWQIADTENRGFLSPAGFSIVLRLIGHCQAGRSPDLELATKRTRNSQSSIFSRG